MKNLSILLSIILLIGSCVPDVPEPVEGCTDNASLNYNPDAEVDNGTCQYVSDLYVGVYLVSDTSSYFDPGTQQTVNYTGQYTFSISKVNNTEVAVSSFSSCGSLNANVSETLLSFSNLGNCNVSNVVVKRVNEELKFTYQTFGGLLVYTKGTARKQ
jgi:hypothetical protein